MKIDDDITPYQINKQLPQSTPSAIEKADEKTPTDEKKVEGIQGPEQDTIVNISKTSQRAQHIREIISSEPDIREDKVSELKERIESGRYRIDHNLVADKLVDSFLDEIS
jgi:negative regulator of flagellin synthesis FlgM